MKRITVCIIAAALAISATAGVSLQASHNTRSHKLVNTEMRRGAIQSLKAAAPQRVITEQPQGELKSYLRQGDAIYPEGQNIYMGSQDEGRMDVVFADEGKVYLKNILYNIGEAWANSWVEGQLSDDGTQIIVPLGQSVYHSYTYQADILLAWGTTVVAYDEETGAPYIDFIIDDRMTEVVYAIDGETITLEGGLAPIEDEANPYWGFEATGLGTYWTDDYSFAGAMEWYTVFTETEPLPPTGPSVITEQPEGDLYTLHRNSAYILSSDGIYNGKTDGMVNVVLNAAEGKAYIENPLWWHDYGYWVEGDYDAESGLIIVPTGQYVYYNEDMEYGIQLMWGSTYAYETSEGYRLGYTIDNDTEEIMFYLEGTNLYLIGCMGDINAEFPEWGNATGLMGMYSDLLTMTCIEFTNRDANGDDLPFGQLLDLSPAVPAAPTIDEWVDGGDEEGNTFLLFTLPSTDVDGHPIAIEYLSFSIFVDNGEGPEVFTFDADTYTYDVPWDMTEIPYDIFSMGYDITPYGCVFYRTNYGDNPLFTQNIGIQAYYDVEGVKNGSEIVWLYDIPHSGVNEVNASKSVASVRYFNVAGQEMAQPAGMTIQVTTYTDGTTSAVKVVK